MSKRARLSAATEAKLSALLERSDSFAQGAESAQATLDFLGSMKEELTAMFEQLKQQVKESGAVTQAAIDLIRNLKDKIQAAGVDPAELQKIVDDLDAQEQALAAAVAPPAPAAPAPMEPVAPVAEEPPVSAEPAPEPAPAEPPAPQEPQA